MPSRTYLLSFPERVVRSALGFSAGLLREIGEVALPRTVRRGQLYKSLVDTTPRYVIEQVGGAKGVYPGELPQPPGLSCAARRGSCHRAARHRGLSHLSNMGIRGTCRSQRPRTAAQFENVDQLLDGLEKTSSRLAQTINAPPRDVRCAAGHEVLAGAQLDAYIEVLMTGDLLASHVALH